MKKICLKICKISQFAKVILIIVSILFLIFSILESTLKDNILNGSLLYLIANITFAIFIVLFGFISSVAFIFSFFSKKNFLFLIGIILYLGLLAPILVVSIFFSSDHKIDWQNWYMLLHDSTEDSVNVLKDVKGDPWAPLKAWGAYLLGMLTVIGYWLNHRRTEAIEKSNVEVERNNKAEELQASLTSAIDHLGDEKSQIHRIGAVHELDYIALIWQEKAEMVLDILCSYLRTSSPIEEDKKKDKRTNIKENLQPIIDIFRKEKKDKFSSNFEKIDWSGADLSMLDMVKIQLGEKEKGKGAKLNEARLQNLEKAELSNVVLYDADLRGADLRKTNLRWADLRGADLRGADLKEADLKEADLTEVIVGIDMEDALANNDGNRTDEEQKWLDWKVSNENQWQGWEIGSVTIEEWEKGISEEQLEIVKKRFPSNPKNIQYLKKKLTG